MRISTALFSLAVALGVVSAIPFNLAPAPATVEECGPETDLLKIEYVNITPNPPLKGQTLTIEGKGQLSGDIVEGAQIFVVVKVGLIKLLNQKYDFCTESVKVGKPCPVLAGEHYLEHSVDLPKEIPPGKYTANIKVVNPPPSEEEEGEEVTCLIVKAQFLI